MQRGYVFCNFLKLLNGDCGWAKEKFISFFSICKEKKLRKRVEVRALTLMQWSLGSSLGLDDLKGLFEPK